MGRTTLFLLLLIASAACSSARQAHPEAPKPPNPNLTVDEVPTPARPLSSNEPERWMFRVVVLGGAIVEARRTTHELRVSAHAADLIVTHERAPLNGTGQATHDERALAWHTTKVESFHGTHRARGAEIALDLSTPEGDSIRRTCMKRTVPVALASAVRVKTPGFTGECGDRGVWKPDTTTPLPVLVCQNPGETESQDGVPAGGEVFAAAPGVDYAAESSGCYIQGGGLRLPP